MIAEIEETIDIMFNFTEILEQRSSTEDSVDYRLALIEFRDYPVSYCGLPGDFPSEIYTFSEGNFTTNISEYLEKISSITLGSGGDGPDSHLTALQDSIDLNYRQDAKKFNIMIAYTMPHAKDCSKLSGGNTYIGMMDTDCYDGPEYAQDIINKLVDESIKFDYINQVGPYHLCDNRIIADNMTSETGGEFYDYTREPGIKQILLDLAAEIRREYEEERYNHLKVMFYNETDSCTGIISSPPLPLETKTYELDKCIDNIKEIKIYPVIVTESGIQVIGHALDSWEADFT